MFEGARAGAGEDQETPTTSAQRAQTDRDDPGASDEEEAFSGSAESNREALLSGRGTVEGAAWRSR
jgi:hypothetical protein